MERESLEAVCTAFGLGELAAWEALGGTRNRNWRCETNRGTWAVRQRYAGYCGVEWLDFDGAALQHLMRTQAPIAEPRLTADGTPWRQIGQATFQASAFVQGRAFREGNVDDVVRVAEGLARFHRAGRGFSGRYDKLGPRGETEPDVLLRQATQIAVDSPDARPVVARYRTWIERAMRDVSLDAWRGLPHTLVHGDVQPANILLALDGQVVFVDLDWCSWQARIYDLAWALLLCCTRHAAPTQGDDIWSLTQAPIPESALVVAFLETYSGDAGALTTNERRALPAQIVLSWCSCRLAGALKVPSSERAAFLDRPPVDVIELVRAFLV